jgi:hypothetical protein
MDASIRIPRGITLGNFVDMGNYYQCLAINKQALDMTVEGKYCAIHIPLNQGFNVPEIGAEFPWGEKDAFYETKTRSLDKETLKGLNLYENSKKNFNNILGNRNFASRLDSEHNFNFIIDFLSSSSISVFLFIL